VCRGGTITFIVSRGFTIKETEDIEEVRKLFNTSYPMVSLQRGGIEIVWERCSYRVTLVSVKICGSVVWSNTPVYKDPVDVSFKIFETLRWTLVYYKVTKLVPVDVVVEEVVSILK
jgi:hypothetical protein